MIIIRLCGHIGTIIYTILYNLQKLTQIKLSLGHREERVYLDILLCALDANKIKQRIIFNFLIGRAIFIKIKNTSNETNKQCLLYVKRYRFGYDYKSSPKSNNIICMCKERREYYGLSFHSLKNIKAYRHNIIHLHIILYFQQFK